MEKLIVNTVMLIITIAFIVKVKIDMKKKLRGQLSLRPVNLLLLIMILTTLYLGGVIFSILYGLTKEVDKHIIVSSSVLLLSGIYTVFSYLYQISKQSSSQPD